MTNKSPQDVTGLRAGDKHYRAWVGFPTRYDWAAMMEFRTLTTLGLRENHYLLDLGCGSLRAGRLLIPYLLPGHYFGIEPEAWLIEAGFDYELGHSIKEVKKPRFDYNADFDLGVFGQTFDYIMAQSIFSHAALWQIEDCLKSAYSVMHDESIFITTYCPQSPERKDYAGTEWVYPKCCRYHFETMVRLGHEAGLTCEPAPVKHPGWLLYKRDAK